MTRKTLLQQDTRAVRFSDYTITAKISLHADIRRLIDAVENNTSRPKAKESLLPEAGKPCDIPEVGKQRILPEIRQSHVSPKSHGAFCL
jgi:hypothetical protein